MGAYTYEEEPVTPPLGGVEPALTLGTIEEAKEYSTADESEAETLVDPPQDVSIEIRIGGEEKDEVEEQEDEEEQEVEEACNHLTLWESHPDVDGGWAWVILIAMFGVFLITSGLINTTGMFYVQMLIQYGHSRSYTAWVGSLINAFFMLTGPLSFMFIQVMGARAALIWGSIIMATGYIASAFTTTLEALFFTYGVIVAVGMSFAYSGQITALNQYFYKRHSIATSTAMVGIGLGMFFLSTLTEYTIKEYGWQGAYIWNAGLSLQIAVFGALIFPLQPIPEGKKTQQEAEENLAKQSRPLKGLRPSKSRMLLEKSLNHRSFSSLRLSAEASFLSHSQISLQAPTHHVNLLSNQHSFCSKGSHLVGSIRSNGHSFCRDSHAELSHFDLRSNQFSFYQRDSFLDFGLHSNAHSFCSRRDSQAGLNGIKSNPHSFIHHHHILLEGEGDSLKGSCGGGRARFMLREGDCDLGCCEPEEDDTGANDMRGHSAAGKNKTRCVMSFQKVKQKLCATLAVLSSKSEGSVLMEARFWLVGVAYFLAMLGTICFFIIYKDYAVSKGVGEYYTIALSGIGIGDLVGRMTTGIFVSSEFVNPVLTFSIVMLVCGLVVLTHAFIHTSTQFLILTAIFGILNGSLNVLIAVTPSLVFGRDKLSTVFGYILFLGGAGALIGAPIAGSIVDATGSFNGVVGFSSGSLVAGAGLMFCCYLVHRNTLLAQTQDQEV
ncbi:Monocarboxylate transporter 14 [Chionoecetes opilio]|uniref:Monocarboxylate transporter 14 n=1 Tax=Chionoecetes opilio TaxID=41210 RepID=A0A8J4Y874_CHIOP|nr:Monocarboxylate transporter 14 [Chionoecetes opilio]